MTHVYITTPHNATPRSLTACLPLFPDHHSTRLLYVTHCSPFGSLYLFASYFFGPFFFTPRPRHRPRRYHTCANPTEPSNLSVDQYSIATTCALFSTEMETSTMHTYTLLCTWMASNHTFAVNGYPPLLYRSNGGTMIMLYLQPFPCQPVGNNTTTISTTGYLYPSVFQCGNLDVAVLVSSFCTWAVGMAID